MRLPQFVRVERSKEALVARCSDLQQHNKLGGPLEAVGRSYNLLRRITSAVFGSPAVHSASPGRRSRLTD